MNNEQRINLLKNMKETFGLKMSQSVALLIGQLAIITSIFAAIALSTNNVGVRWLLSGIYLVVLYFAGIFRTVRKISNRITQIEKIDFALHDLYKGYAKSERIDELIRNLYERKNVSSNINPYWGVKQQKGTGRWLEGIGIALLSGSILAVSLNELNMNSLLYWFLLIAGVILLMFGAALQES